MNLLAIDTATEKFSVALAVSSKDNASPVHTWLFEVDAGLRHSELVMDSVDMLTRSADLRPEDLHGVVCTGGPGSFTGLRIGFSIAKGLALSLGIPFAAIPTLKCMAWPFFSWPGLIVPVLDAKKEAFFCALYRDGKQTGVDMDASPAEIARAIANEPPGQTLLVGPGSDLLYKKLRESPITGVDTANIKPDKSLRWGNAETLLRIALQTNIFATTTIDYSHGPEYIRKSDAELNKPACERQQEQG